MKDFNMIDRLEHLFKKQANQNNFYYDSDRFAADENYRKSVLKDYTLGIYDQTAKMIECFGYKKHTLDSKENTYNAIEQCIDIIKYAIGILTFEGKDSDDFYALFINKSNLLEERWNQKNDRMHSNMRVALFDIDGVLADYSGAYEKFLIEKIGLKKVEGERNSYSFYESFGIKREEEEKYNEMFVDDGGFRNIQAYEGAKELVDYCKSVYDRVVFITARPSWIHKRLYTDTNYWLNENGLVPDVLLWSKDKADVIINHVFPAKVEFMVEDRDKHAIEVSHIGVFVYLLDKGYNKGLGRNNMIERVNSLDYLKELLIQKNNKRR
jgi:hypothetical protein